MRYVRVYNFSAGPAMLPLEVLEQASSEMTDWLGSGMSVLEVSHRGKDFVDCSAEAEATLRRLVGISDDYSVLFLQGGATGEFAAIPLNITAPGDTVSYVNTGAWSKKAIAEAKLFDLDVQVVADTGDTGYMSVPAQGSFEAAPGSTYLHYTANETIGGVEFGYVPASDAPLVSDFSSTYLSRPIDVSKFGVVYGGAQKNLGPSGLAITIVRRDLLGRARTGTPSALHWAKQDEADSMLNTPPTFSVYLFGLVLKWIEGKGGLEAMEKLNRAKAEALYSAIDASSFYTNPVAVDSRSLMNVPFTLADAGLDKDFLAGAEAAGMTNLKGHRSVGGMRASIYNAMPMEGVQALIDYMKEFERTHA